MRLERKYIYRQFSCRCRVSPNCSFPQISKCNSLTKFIILFARLLTKSSTTSYYAKNSIQIKKIISCLSISHLGTQLKTNMGTDREPSTYCSDIGYFSYSKLSCKTIIGFSLFLQNRLRSVAYELCRVIEVW